MARAGAIILIVGAVARLPVALGVLKFDFAPLADAVQPMQSNRGNQPRGRTTIQRD